MIASSLLLDGYPIAVALSSSADSFNAFSGQETPTPGPPTPGPPTPGSPSPGSQSPGPPTPGVGTPGTDSGAVPPPQGNPFQSLITFALIGAVVWFLIFAPERKARKKREAMLSEVKKGDKIVTTGGMHGEVVDVKEHTVIIKAGDARLTFSRASIHEIRQPKEEIASDPE